MSRKQLAGDAVRRQMVAMRGDAPGPHAPLRSSSTSARASGRPSLSEQVSTYSISVPSGPFSCFQGSGGTG